jgi:inorganic pyrophosphatase
MKLHPWHEVSAGKNIPELVTGIVEIPKNHRAKYELDKESGMLKLDRVLYSSINYPANYGFIPQTYCDDDDPLDILVMSQVEIAPMCLVESKVIGVMQMIDGDEKDDKIIAVASNDMSVNHFNDISELPEHYIRELRSFFEDYKKLEHSPDAIVEQFKGREFAHEVILQSIEDYKSKFG